MTNALAEVAVKNLEPAVAWYTKLLGRGPTTRPRATLAEWDFPKGGWPQVFADASRAGKSSVTLVENDLAARLTLLEKAGVPAFDTTASPFVKTAIVNDPDGNQIVFAEGVTKENAATAK